MKSHANDAMIRRLEDELEERNSFCQGLIAGAQDGERDLNETEEQSLADARNRIEKIKSQLESLEATRDIAVQVRQRAKDLDSAISTARKSDGQPVEYRTAGAYVLDQYQASLGDRPAKERLEVFHRVADHQKTGDNLGVIPDPIIGEVVNFIDAARPIVSALGPRDIPSATWHRPKVTQHASVAAQGVAGAAADEKAELVSQKMTITKLTANAVTYGGYVNVSRQNIDFSSPQIMDLVINDLATQYAVETEQALGTELDSSTAANVGYGTTPTAETINSAVWEAAADVYTAVRGQGRLALVLAPDKLELFGPLFQPVSELNPSVRDGFEAGRFGQGVMGAISGVPVIMSSGLASTKVFMISTSAVEVFEQRVGTLQVTEPSVLGVQVAYAGYFTPLLIEDGGVVELTQT